MGCGVGQVASDARKAGSGRVTRAQGTWPPRLCVSARFKVGSAWGGLSGRGAGRTARRDAGSARARQALAAGAARVPPDAAGREEAVASRRRAWPPGAPAAATAVLLHGRLPRVRGPRPWDTRAASVQCLSSPLRSSISYFSFSRLYSWLVGFATPSRAAAHGSPLRGSQGARVCGPARAGPGPGGISQAGQPRARDVQPA